MEPRLFDRLSDVQTPQGILAVFPFPNLSPDPDDLAPLALLLDRLRDPGNLGTLLRSAAAAGVNAVYLSPETVDPWNPKVVRAGMGAHFRVPLIPLDAAVLDELGQRCLRRVIASAAATHPYDATNWTEAAALRHRRRNGGRRPRPGGMGYRGDRHPAGRGVESLNAAVAGAVILFEAARQRRRDGSGRTRMRLCFRDVGTPVESISRVCSRVFMDLKDEWMVDSASGPLV